MIIWNVLTMENVDVLRDILPVLMGLAPILMNAWLVSTGESSIWFIFMDHFYGSFLWNHLRCNLETENCINTIGSYDCEIIPLFCEEGFYMDGQICRGNIWRYIFNITYNTEKYKKTSNSVHGSTDFQFETPDRTGPEKTTSGLVKKPKQRFGKMRLNFLSSFDQESVKNIFYICYFRSSY